MTKTKRLLIAPLVLLISWIMLSLFFVFLSFHIFTRLSAEKPIASVYFQKLKPQIYTAYLSSNGDNDPAEYEILGDQWRIDARFIKLEAWVNLLGLDAQYNLERLEGRYSNIKDANTRPHLAHDLGQQNLFVIPQLVLDYNFLIDAEYGSSTYQTIDLSKLYTVYRTQSGLIIRQSPLADTDKDEKGVFETLIDVFN